MFCAILLGMGMPTVPAYVNVALLLGPLLANLGVSFFTAHMFVFYFAVASAITPPVALASFAAAGISGSNPLATSIASFKIGIAAFVVPFMFFYNSTLLMQGETLDVLRAAITAVFGIFLLAAAVQGWFMGYVASIIARILLVISALMMISGGLVTDLVGIAIALIVFFGSKFLRTKTA